MSDALEARVRSALAHSVFAERSGAVAALLAEGPDAAAALAAMPDALFAGLARAAAASAEQTRIAVRHRGLLARAAALESDWPERRAAELDREAGAGDAEPSDLETFLDEIRLLRREEMLLAACLDFSGLCEFEALSRLLSALAEAIVRRALRVASRSLRGPAPELGVVAMGKLGGREFTYHSDLDLIFLYGGGVEAVPSASRTVQRLISYVSTMTGAGIAYAVDSRLRPSGNQGMLVTSFGGFEAYQSSDAATWEYLALVRARPIAGSRDATQAVIERVEARAFGQGGARWSEVADMRRRIEAERAGQGAKAIELKTGAGGLMDVEFLAEGGVLEVGRCREAAPIPAVPALLAATAGAEAARATLDAYRFLRRVESRMRWCAGRAVESFERSDPRLSDVAELVEPGLGAARLAARIESARAAIRRGFEDVIAAGTIRALR
jgi:glutamate-ammonia-ligase adenylyltransferase